MRHAAIQALELIGLASIGAGIFMSLGTAAVLLYSGTALIAVGLGLERSGT